MRTEYYFRERTRVFNGDFFNVFDLKIIEFIFCNIFFAIDELEEL